MVHKRRFRLGRLVEVPELPQQDMRPINWKKVAAWSLSGLTFYLVAKVTHSGPSENWTSVQTHQGAGGLWIPLAAAGTTFAAVEYGPSLLEALDKATPMVSSSHPVPIVAPLPPTESRDWAKLLYEVLPSESGAPATPIWTPPPDAQWREIVLDPSVIIILGRRGSGKSGLGFRQLELFRDRAAPYVVGLPAAAQKYLPEWIGVMDRVEDVPEGSVVLVDEAYLTLHARSSMSADGRGIGAIVNLSRQRRQTLVFVVQEARQLDVNIISQADVIAIKELSEISREFERRELRVFTDKARAAFAGLSGDRRRWTWVYSEAAGNVGLVQNELASFWSSALSRAFAGGQSSQTSSDGSRSPVRRKGTRTPREELTARAKQLRAADISYGQIAKNLGVSKSTAWELVNGDQAIERARSATG